MAEEFRRYGSYKDVIERLLLFSGLWPCADPGVLYRLLPFVHFAACGLMSGFILNFSLHNSAQLDLLFKGLSLTFSYWAVLQKTFCVIVYRKRLMKLHTSLKNAFNDDLEDLKLRPILLSPLRTFSSPSSALIVMTFGLHSIYWITLLVIIAVQYFRHVDTIKYSLPYPTFYPWTTNGWWYAPHLIFEFYTGIAHAAFGSSIDTLFAYYIFLICGQLRTLSHRMMSVKSSEDYHKVIRECVVKHQILIKCQEHLERIYGPIVLCMLIVSAMIMCALIYQASHMSLGKAALVLVYLAMKSAQTLFYGAFGSFLAAETDMFRQAIYASVWPGSGEKPLMTDTLVMLTYNQLPMKACSLSTISIDMFVTVCNTAVSYFFMLRTLEEDHST